MASAKIFFPAGVNHIPQMDFEVGATENGGWEATQSFHAKKSMLTAGGALANLFVRGRSIVSIDPNCPIIYASLGLKSSKITDIQPGVVKIDCVFTGYSSAGGNGSSGQEPTVPTYSLRKDNEEIPLGEHHKWTALPQDVKNALAMLMDGRLDLNDDGTSPGTWDADHKFFTNAKNSSGSFIVFSGDSLVFAKRIAEGKPTYKRPAWTWTVRTEGSTGFTPAQLNKAGKIVATPPGNPPTPGSGWTWLFIGPDQEQSGEKRYVKDMQFQLIRNNAENQFLYGD